MRYNRFIRYETRAAAEAFGSGVQYAEVETLTVIGVVQAGEEWEVRILDSEVDAEIMEIGGPR